VFLLTRLKSLMKCSQSQYLTKFSKRHLVLRGKRERFAIPLDSLFQICIDVSRAHLQEDHDIANTWTPTHFTIEYLNFFLRSIEYFNFSRWGQCEVFTKVANGKCQPIHSSPLFITQHLNEEDIVFIKLVGHCTYLVLSKQVV